MSDYSRFISYMYLYENAMKTMNAGFVKVESRNGQCRISLSLKNVYTGLERCQVYMFIRFGQDLRGVYIGDVRIKIMGANGISRRIQRILPVPGTAWIRCPA